MAVTKVTTKVLADDAVTIDKIADAALVTETEGISSNDNDTTLPTSAAVKDYVDTQDATKEDTITGAATTITGSDLTASKALVSNASGKVAASTVTDTELGYVSGVTSSIQDQFDALTDNDTTYTVSAVDSGDDAIIRLTDSNSGTDDVTLAAGNNITLTPVGDTITIASTASGSVSEAFKTIAVSGQNSVVADGATDTLTLAAGSNINLTTDSATDTITIASTASGGGGSVDVVTTQHTGDGTTKGFALDSAPGDNDAVQVYLNGVYQVKDAANYSISGSTLTFVTAPTNSTAIEFVHFKLTTGGGGGISWDTTVKTAAFTAVAGEGYFVNTTSAAITVTLPSSPSAGDEVTIVDYAGTANTYNITITSSDNINGSSVDAKISYARAGLSMVYVDATQGWLSYNAANEGSTSFTQTVQGIDVQVLIVAGGGGSAVAAGGGGGGAGGVQAGTLTTNTGPATVFNVTVGGGGAASSGGYPSLGTSGSLSKIVLTGGTSGTYTADGGGYGGAHVSSNDAAAGGSGGGGGGFTGNSTNTSGGASTQTSTSPLTGYGNAGADGGTGSGYTGGGGGGAGAAGAYASGSVAGSGGVGITTSIISTSVATAQSVGEVVSSSVYFAGGGGGGVESSSHTAGIGGYGGGTDGTNSSSPSNSPNNTGGGAGGGGNSAAGGANGGSGVVILRMATSDYSGTTTGSPTVVTETPDTILIFKSSGSYTT